MPSPFRIAIAGLGTVGSGLLQLIHENAPSLTHRTNRDWQVVAVSARDQTKPRPELNKFPNAIWENSPEALLNHQPDVIVELIGGSSDIPHNLIESALDKSIAVVTANKALIAEHGFALAETAEKNKTPLRFEAAVAGATPVIKVIRDSLAANKIASIAGILNSTCNVILTMMSEKGITFDQALKQAQDAGYAEAEPSLDIDGVDSAHKLAILATMAFGSRCQLDIINHSGITDIQQQDIEAARDFGFSFRLMCFAVLNRDTIDARVSPMLVPVNEAMSTVRGVNNCLEIRGNYCGPIFLHGQGAGAKATASAVAADLAGIARGLLGPPFGISVRQLHQTVQAKSPMALEAYMRLVVINQPGVLAAATKILSEQNISIHSAKQNSSDDRATPVDLILRLHHAPQNKINLAIEKLSQLDCLVDPIACFPIFNHKLLP